MNTKITIERQLFSNNKEDAELEKTYGIDSGWKCTRRGFDSHGSYRYYEKTIDLGSNPFFGKQYEVERWNMLIESGEFDFIKNIPEEYMWKLIFALGFISDDSE